MKTAIAADPEPSRPLYVLRLEEAIRVLDGVIDRDGLHIDVEHPEDHGIEPWVAELLAGLRRD